MSEYAIVFHPSLLGYCSYLLKQLRCELVKVVSPVDPCMGAVSLFINHFKTMFLEELDRSPGSPNEKVLPARCEPQQFEPFLKFGIIQLFLVLLFPCRT